MNTAVGDLIHTVPSSLWAALQRVTPTTRIFRGLWNFLRVSANNFCGAAAWVCGSPFWNICAVLTIMLIGFWAFIQDSVYLTLLFLLGIDILEQMCYNVHTIILITG